MPLLFVQNTKNIGSLARYNYDDQMDNGIKDSAPNYTITQNKNTFQQEIRGNNRRRRDSISDEFNSHQNSDSDSQKEHSDSESLDSQTNILDLEAHAEYDCEPRNKSRGDSFDLAE